jgi:hypothetical protein
MLTNRTHAKNNNRICSLSSTASGVRYYHNTNTIFVKVYEKTLRIFREFSQQKYRYEDLDMNYTYELHIKKLYTAHLENPDCEKEVSNFLEYANSDISLNFLREIGVIIRSYGSPMLLSGSLSWTSSDIRKLTEKWFSNHVNVVLGRPNVRLNFNNIQLIDLERLARAVSHYIEDGRTFLLFRRCLSAVDALSFAQPGSKFILNLACLTPGHLKEQNVAAKEIEDMLDSTDLKAIVNFLIKTGALVTEKIG